MSSSTSEITFLSTFASTTVEFRFYGKAAEVMGYDPAVCAVNVRKSCSGEFISRAERAGVKVTRTDSIE